MRGEEIPEGIILSDVLTEGFPERLASERNGELINGGQAMNDNKQRDGILLLFSKIKMDENENEKRK